MLYEKIKDPRSFIESRSTFIIMKGRTGRQQKNKRTGTRSVRQTLKDMKRMGM